MLRRFWVVFFLGFLTLGGRLASAQTYDTVRVMTYNLLNYPGNNSATRNPEFRKILRYVSPDILVVQEMISAAGVSGFLSNVLNSGQPGTYSSAPFLDGPDTDNALFFKSSLFSFVDTTVLHTQLRDITGFQLRPAGVGADSVDLRIYSCHLKSSQGFEQDRLAEADTLRNHLNSLPDGLFLITAGDMNLYTSTEPAYQELIGSQSDNSGRLYDPINSLGDWNNNSSFAGVHTQSTRTDNLGDGGATGGLDDRFDFLLLSYAFQSGSRWHYVNGTYTEVGNDGNHFNQSINAGTNTAVPDSVANALHTVSDHLPVYLDLYRSLQAPASLVVTLPNSGETWYAGYAQNITWSSQNLSGTVSIKLNRNYPAGAWENIVLNTANDGLHPWTVSPPATTSARVQVISDSQPSVSDVSDANFAVATPVITLLAPNGGETWFLGQSGTIAWSTTGVSDNVRIELNRNYPSGSWEVLYGSAINDGSEAWTVSGAATTHARIRILSVNNAIPGDTSQSDFTIAVPYLSLLAPDGSESWLIGSNHPITWASAGLSGNVEVTLNRTYPNGFWQVISASVPVQNGSASWTVTGPSTQQARVRVRLLSDTTFTDVSSNNFSIHLPPQPPVIAHDPRGDTEVNPIGFTAQVSDDLPGGVTTKLFYRSIGAYDSVTMNTTGYGTEVAANLTLSLGAWDYFLRATDSDLMTNSTDTFSFVVGQSCGLPIAYDDETPEIFGWSVQADFEWAVRFTPPVVPFVLCAADVSIASFHPDSAHSAIIVRVLAADGPGGLPGTVLRQLQKGSIGNVIGGLPSGTGFRTHTLLYDAVNPPLVFASDFYVSVKNIAGGTEAFGHDTSSAGANRSYVWDPCAAQWRLETAFDSITQRGNRIIHVEGYWNAASQLVIRRVSNDIQLLWSATGAPNYHVFQATSATGPFTNLIGTTSDTTLTAVGAVGQDVRAFYIIQSASTP